MAGEQELTPEEKLLKVIQKGEVPQRSAGAEPLTFGDEADAEPIARGGYGQISLAAVNRILVLLILVVIGLSGYEVYRNQPEPEPVYSEEDLDLLDNGEKLVIASLSDTLDMFSARRIFGKPPERWVSGPDHGPKPMQGWRAYVRDNMELTGLSKVIVQQDDGSTRNVMEAIVMDTKKKKMHFLRVDSKIHLSIGDKTHLIEQDIRVDKIEGNKLTFTHGKESITIGETSEKK
jgi:hypothetical protein